MAMDGDRGGVYIDEVNSDPLVRRQTAVQSANPLQNADAQAEFAGKLAGDAVDKSLGFSFIDGILLDGYIAHARSCVQTLQVVDLKLNILG